MAKPIEVTYVVGVVGGTEDSPGPIKLGGVAVAGWHLYNVGFRHADLVTVTVKLKQRIEDQEYQT